MATPTSTTAPVSRGENHDALCAAHAAAIAAEHAKVSAARAAAEAMVSKALDAAERAEAALFAAHEALLDARATKANKTIVTDLMTLVAAFKAAGSRDTAMAVAAGVRKWNSEAERALGVPLQHQLTAAFARLEAKKRPAALLGLGQFDENSPGPAFRVEVGAAAHALDACLRSASPGEVQSALEGLETAVAKAGYGSAGNDPQHAQEILDLWSFARPIDRDRWIVNRRKERHAESVAANEAHQANVRRARMGENDSSWLPGWADDVRRMLGRLVVQHDGRITPEWR